jgi:HK97 family phage prohead protease
MAAMTVAKRRLRMKVRATPDEGAGTFNAQVSTYGLEYDIGWGWTEKILPGCFADSIDAHAALCVFYTHDWPGGPIGVGKATESDNDLTVAGHLYLGMAERIDVVYQAMLDEALEEWSIGFWPEEITWEKDNPTCDQIAKGDLAEASVCVRGANPETGTLELRNQPCYIDGSEPARRSEVMRIRSKFGVPDLGDLKHRGDDPAGHSHEHAHGDTVHAHQHTHGAGNYDHDGSDLEVTHAHDHPADTAVDAKLAARVERAMATPWGRELVAAHRSRRVS